MANSVHGWIIAADDFVWGPPLLILLVGTHIFLTFRTVFSTILGWSYYGERAAEYLWGKRLILPYRIAWVLAVYAGRM